jgi:hypothetical protein
MTDTPNIRVVFKVAEEVALAEFVRMCEKFRVDIDESAMTKAEQEDFAELRAELVKDMMHGRIIVGPDGRPTYQPADGKALTFNPPTGATLMALETYPAHKQIANTMAAMTDMTESKPGEFARMSSRDLQRCSRLAKLFLAAQ